MFVWPSEPLVLYITWNMNKFKSEILIAPILCKQILHPRSHNYIYLVWEICMIIHRFRGPPPIWDSISNPHWQIGEAFHHMSHPSHWNIGATSHLQTDAFHQWSHSSLDCKQLVTGRLESLLAKTTILHISYIFNSWLELNGKLSYVEY